MQQRDKRLGQENQTNEVANDEGEDQQQRLDADIEQQIQPRTAFAENDENRDA